MKIYGDAWRTEFGLSPVRAARSLAELGVSHVTVHNALAPVGPRADDPGSTIASDLRFREALRSKSIAVHEVLPVFYDPDYLSLNPDAHPLDGDGRKIPADDWYIGICPTHPNRIAERVERIAALVSTYEPDGVLLDWIRHPVFWERWTPTNGPVRTGRCRCRRCQGISPGGDGQDQTDARCAQVTAVAQALAEAARGVSADVQLVANIVPFLDDGNRTGQDIGELGSVVDQCALMLYHQIVGRDATPWVADTIATARARTDAPIWACLQVAPAYLNGPYGNDGRSSTITIEEHSAALEAVASIPGTGLMLYHWSDYLSAESRGETRLHQALKDHRSRRVGS